MRCFMGAEAINDFKSFFKIEAVEDIDKFFYKEKTAGNLITELFNRLSHFFSTGIWITKDKLSQWVLANRDVRIENLFDQHVRMKNKVIRLQNNLYLPKKSAAEELKDGFQFFLGFLKSPNGVGTPFPSLKSLAKRVIRQIDKNYGPDQPPRRFLEVGPGTGIFTDNIIRRMTPNDELHLVDYDAKFCEELRKKYAEFPNVKVFHESILDFGGHQYDAVISGLPLNGFQLDFVQKVFEKLDELIAPGGTLSYFDYLYFPQIKMAFSSREDRANIQGILDLKEQYFQAHALGVDKVWKNVPPARVLHHRKAAQHDPVPA